MNQVYRIFDWEKAARLIKERGFAWADAGLSEEIDATSAPIYDTIRGEGIIEDTMPYLVSLWATPVLVVGDEHIPCYYESPTTVPNGNRGWPESAKRILTE